MLSLHLTGKIPFNEVYCHSLIRDSEGRKMSKSLGNVIDPIDIMQGITLDELNNKLKLGNLDPKELKTAEKYQKTSFPQGIPECGADALRMALVGYTTGGGDIAFDVSVIHGYREFTIFIAGSGLICYRTLLQQDLPGHQVCSRSSRLRLQASLFRHKVWQGVITGALDLAQAFGCFQEDQRAS